MRTHGVSILFVALCFGIALLAHAAPLSKANGVSSSIKLLKSSKVKGPATKAPKIKATKAKAVPVKAPKAKVTQGKTTKVSTAKVGVVKGKVTKAGIANAKATKPAQTTAGQANASKNIAKQGANPACSRLGAHRRSECAIPNPNPAPATAEVNCAGFTTCKTCVSKKNDGQCVFNTRTEKCVGTKDPKAGSAIQQASKASQCKDFEQNKQKEVAAKVAAEQKRLQEQAQQILRKPRPGSTQSLQDHVISGPKAFPASGRHLFSIWKKNPVVAKTIRMDPTTRLADLDTSSVDAKTPTKTVWVDELPVGATGNVYSRGKAIDMCRDAIVQILKDEGKFESKPGDTVSARSHGVVVEGINNIKVCISVSEESCFPKDITPSQKALGEQC